MKSFIVKAIVGVLGMFIAFLAAMIAMIYIMSLGAEQAVKELRIESQGNVGRTKNSYLSTAAIDEYESRRTATALSEELQRDVYGDVLLNNGMEVARVERFRGDMKAGKINYFGKTIPICQDSRYSRCFKVYLNKTSSVYSDKWSRQLCTKTFKNSLKGLGVDFVNFEISPARVSVGNCESSTALNDVMKNYRNR